MREFDELFLAYEHDSNSFKVLPHMMNLKVAILSHCRNESIAYRS
jgi:hypothetical protein